jgi:hypothetical protein
MEGFEDLKERFQRFERAAAKGHEESIWILSVVKDVEMEADALKEAFARTEEPLGWYLAGKLSYGEEEFEFYKKSAEGGCSWGQEEYAEYFRHGDYAGVDESLYVEWLEKAANQNNPDAMAALGVWFVSQAVNVEKALLYYGVGAEMGWQNSMYWLAKSLRDGEGCAKDLRKAVMWSAKVSSYCDVVWEVLEEVKLAVEKETTEDLDCDLDQLCYALGWGLYWYKYGGADWEVVRFGERVFGEHCLDYYCEAVELQQESIVTFLLCWNRNGGVKDVGVMIGKMVWEGREDNLLKRFEARRK